MIRDTFFSAPRFVNLCRKEMVESWKANLLRFVMMYGIMAIAFVWNGYFRYNYPQGMIDRGVEQDPIWYFELTIFLWAMVIMGLLSASFVMERMKTKTNRIAVLMTPATMFEKFLSRWLVFTFGFLIVFLIAFKLADYTRVSIYSLIYPDAKGAILPVNLGYLVGSGKRWFLFNETYELIFVLSIYCFIQSLFVLGSSVWPKNSFLKTFVAVTIIVLIYVVVGIAVGNMLFNGSHNRDCSYIFSSITEQQAFNLASIAFVLFALVNCTLAYFRFKESEIIQRM